LLVDPQISRAKVARELTAWEEQAEVYRRRGYVLRQLDELTVEVTFFARLPLGAAPLPVVTACARFSFENYDLWAPSVQFVDFFTGALSRPAADALEFRPGGVARPEGPQLLLIDPHPNLRRPFICQRGFREYHLHPEHNGDDWLLYRGELGHLAPMCERLWRWLAQSVIGFRSEVLELPPPLGRQASALLVQNDPDAVAEQARAVAQAQAQAQAQALAQMQTQALAQMQAEAARNQVAPRRPYSTKVPRR
jgi:hypothetical protein